MIKHGFVEKDIEPSAVADHIKELLVNENFKITSDETRDALWEIHAKKSDRERIVLGKVRDVDVVIAGAQGKFEVQLHAGIWGRDMAIPAIEGVATFGIATAAELHSGHEFEMRIWEQIVKQIDPTLKICKLDGLLFKTDDDLNKHMQEHQAQNSGSMMGMGMMGMMGMGMLGMGMMMPGMWI
ncbi:MAG: hypothetical protein M1166_01250 [Candidatus Thermoplasmatota archaeon]|jgi:hypothetical protein|nr:hypothetical protein [Candidatus Thermoplasmatota archaeon]